MPKGIGRYPHFVRHRTISRRVCRSASALALLTGAVLLSGCAGEQPLPRFAPQDASPAATSPQPPAGAPQEVAPPPPAPPTATREALIAPASGRTRETTLDLLESQHMLTATNVTITDLLCVAYRTPEPNENLPRISALRIATHTELPAQLYDVRIVVPGGRAEQIRAALRKAVEDSFGLVVTRQMRDTAALALRAPQGKLVGQHPNPDTLGSHVTLDGSDLNVLADKLEDRLGVPVSNETGLKSSFWVDIPATDIENPDDMLDEAAVRQALQQQLGLQLVPAQRKVEFLIVSRLPGR
jgi:uncharacterized protein (TIGR03435 family)